MNSNRELEDADVSTIEVDVPILLRLSAGSAIFVARGEAWITQEGRADDFIVAEGERFDVANRQPLVISGTQGRLQLFVVAPAVARRHPQRHVQDFATDRAAALRARAQASIGRALLQRARSVLARLRASLAPRPRVPTH